MLNEITFSIRNPNMLKRKFMVDISGFDGLLQRNVTMNDLKSYIRQKLNETRSLMNSLNTPKVTRGRRMQNQL